MRVARFIADQRTNYRVPHTITCALLGVSLAWFYTRSAACTGRPVCTLIYETTAGR